MDKAKKAVRKLGKRLRQLREGNAWTQEHVAALVGVEQAYISSIERGKLSPSFPKLARIAEAFNMTISQLCEGV